MSKIVDSLNQIWHQQEGDVIKIGLTRSFLDGLDECWHILPAFTRAVKVKSPLLTLESNDGLTSLLSPIAGYRIDWNDRATNFPDKLTEDDVLMTLGTVKPAVQQAIPAPSILDIEAQRPALHAQRVAARMAETGTWQERINVPVALRAAGQRFTNNTVNWTDTGIGGIMRSAITERPVHFLDELQPTPAAPEPF